MRISIGIATSINNPRMKVFMYCIHALIIGHCLVFPNG
jgi:hypothetical protein